MEIRVRPATPKVNGMQRSVCEQVNKFETVPKASDYKSNGVSSAQNTGSLSTLESTTSPKSLNKSKNERDASVETLRSTRGIQNPHIDSQAQGSIPLQAKPPIHGKGKGIQGRDNSCYLDSTLMAFFYGSNFLDTFFYVKCATELQELVVRELKALLSQLTTYNYCPHENTKRLRNALAKINSKLIDEMMDVEELITTLCGQALNLHPFIEYQTGTSNYYHQLVISPDRSLPTKIGYLPLLLKQSLVQQNLEIKNAAKPLFLLKMPRANGTLIWYDVIIPSLTLHIPIANKPERVMDLHAVICLKHCHYTCFIRSENKWYYYDSMAGDGPEVTHVEGLEDVLLRIQNYYNPAEEYASEIKRLISDIHMCLYVDKTRNHGVCPTKSIEPPAKFVDKQAIPVKTYNAPALLTVPPNTRNFNNALMHTDVKPVPQKSSVTSTAINALLSLLYVIWEHNELFKECIKTSYHAEILNTKVTKGIYTEEARKKWKPILKQAKDAKSAVEFLNKLDFPTFIKFSDPTNTETMSLDLFFTSGSSILTVEQAFKFSTSKNNSRKFIKAPNPVLILTSKIKRRTSLQIDISHCLEKQKSTVLNVKAVIGEDRGIIFVYTRRLISESNFQWTLYKPGNEAEIKIPKLDAELNDVLNSNDKHIRGEDCRKISEFGRMWIYG